MSSTGLDGSSIQLAAKKLNEKNFREWAQSVKFAIDGKGKLEYLTGETKQSAPIDDVALQQWRSENSMVTSWLVNSMKPIIEKNYIFLPTVKEV